VSSILEALKELEGDRARATKKATSVVDTPPAPERSLGALIPLSGGLAIGIVAFGLYAWGPRLVGSPPGPPPPPAPPSAPATESAAAETKAPPRTPEWLERVEPPRAHFAPPPDAPAPPRPATPAAEAPAEEGAAKAAARPAPTPVQTPKATAMRGGDRQVQVEGLAFSAHTYQRTVTLLVDGRRATLHQGEALGGVEVQLIMADGVYLQRGAEVFFVNWSR
jgi:hypothetical protein